MSRTFTPEEANEALVELRPIVERMVQHRRNLTAAQHQQAELVTSIAGNGGDMVPSDLHEAAETIQREAEAISACAEQINAVGAEVKSLEEEEGEDRRDPDRRAAPEVDVQRLPLTRAHGRMIIRTNVPYLHAGGSQ